MIQHISVNGQDFKLNNVFFDICSNTKHATLPRKELQYPIFYGATNRIVSTNGNILATTKIKLEQEVTGVGLIIDNEVILDDSKLREILLQDYDKALEEKIYDIAMEIVKDYKKNPHCIKYNDAKIKYYTAIKKEKDRPDIVEFNFNDKDKCYLQKVYFDYILPFFKELDDVEVYYDDDPLKKRLYFKLKNKILVIMPMYIDSIEFYEQTKSNSIFG